MGWSYPDLLSIPADVYDELVAYFNACHKDPA